MQPRSSDTASSFLFLALLSSASVFSSCANTFHPCVLQRRAPCVGQKLTLSGLELLSLLGAANTAVEAAEGDALLLLDNVAQVSVGLLELHAVDGGSGLAGVLEVNTQVLAARLGGLLHKVGVVESVSDLLSHNGV